MRNPHPNQAFVKLSAIALLGFGLVAISHPDRFAQIAAAKQPQRSALSTIAKPSQQQNASFIVAQQPVQTDVSQTLVDQGQNRTYFLHTPPTYNPNQPMPLVMAFHGSGEQGQQMAQQTALNQLADRAGFIVVYPDGINHKWNVSGKSAENNIAFVQHLITQLQQMRSIDAQRIYATGLSNGGIFVQQLACEAPGEFAAFATVAGSLPVRFKSICQRQTPVSLLMINGTGDPIVPWQGGTAPNVRVGRDLSIPPIPDVVEFWRQHNACAAPPTIEKRPDNRVETTDYQNCQDGSEVKLIALQGAGHVWTGGGYGTSAYIDSTQTVWDFLQRHRLGTVAAKSNR